MPFIRLNARRALGRPDLPSDLAEFYAEHEGAGLSNDWDCNVRTCRLDEVSRISWRDLHILGDENCPEGWERFAGFRIGLSSFFDEVVYVLAAPSCPAGAILTLGVDVAGPGGSGPTALECSLVLAPSFNEWRRHLEQTGGVEYGLAPGNLADLTEAQQRELRQYYKTLHPGVTWAQRFFNRRPFPRLPSS